MERISKRIIACVAISAILLTVFALPLGRAKAEMGIIGISPAYPKSNNDRSRGIFIHEVDPGKSFDDGILIQNSSEKPITVLVGGVDSISSTGGSFACQQEAEKQKAVGTWFTFKQKEAEIPAKSSITVDFTVLVPKNASPGEHNGCVVVREKPGQKDDDAKSGVQLSYRSAIRMAITVSGKLKKELSFETIKVSRIPSGDYNVSPVTKNSGNVSLDVTSRAQLTDVFGRKTAVQESKYPTFPGETNEWKYEFKRPYWGGIYKARVSVSYNANTADSLGLGASETKRLRKDTRWFVMLPAPLAGVAEICILLLPFIIIVFLIVRRKRRKNAEKYWRSYVVQHGDSLGSIAETHHISWKRLAKTNRLKVPYHLSVGQELRVPEARGKMTKWAVADEGDVPSNPTTQNLPKQNVQATLPARPVKRSNHDPASETVPTPKPSVGGWVSPRSSSYEQEQNDDDDSDDWREGADDAELGRIERAWKLPRLRSQKPTISKAKRSAKPKKRIAKKRK